MTLGFGWVVLLRSEGGEPSLTTFDRVDEAYGLACRLARMFPEDDVQVLTFAEAEDLGLIEG